MGAKPVVFATAAMLEAAKRRIATPQNDRWDKAWNVTLTRALNSLSVTPSPYQGTEYQRYFDTGVAQAGIARDTALAFALTGDQRYFEKARESLLAHAHDSEQNPTPAKSQPPDQGLVVARVMAIFCYAYSLIYDALNGTDRSTIESWMAKMVPLIRANQKYWVDNNYFGKQLFNNHIGAHMMGLAVLGFTLRDKSVIEYVLQSNANPRNFVDLVQGVILMPNDTLFEGDPTRKSKAPAVQAGEIYDRYRASEGKGFPYAMLHLRQLTLIAEVATNNGVRIKGTDPYKVTGTRGRCLETAYTFYADFFITGDPSSRGGYYAKEKVTALDDCLYELAHRQFPANDKIRQVIEKRDSTASDYETFGATASVTHGAS